MSVENKSNKYILKKTNEYKYLSPEYTYYLITGNNTKYYVKTKSPVLKEQLVFEDNNEKFYANISGTVMGRKIFEDKNYLVIRNDYHEKYNLNKTLRKKINKLTKREMLDILINADASDYSSNIKYFVNNFDSIDSLVLSLLICEDSDKIYSEVFNKYNSDILEIFDAISQVFEIKNPIIILSDTDDNNIEFVTNLSGMYPDIRIVLSHDKYPASHPLLITRKLNLNNALVLTSMDLYYLYSIIKRNKKVFEKTIYITGENLEFNYLVDTKLNVLVKDIFEFCNIETTDEDILCKNSAIKAEIISPFDIIDSTVDSIVIAKKTCEKQKECINCGLCNKYCPQNINPQIYKLNKKPFPGKCIDCNMCSYICPSKIRKDI
ncbi:MAG: hypothetical protein J5634_03420 [Bacilli bacterium]|nr:hypothetical protein [Bacilli bacterium]